MSHPEKPAGNQALAAVFCSDFPLKTVGLSAFMTIFFLGYFWVLHHPSRPFVTMHLTAVDRLVPFTPSAAWLYLSLWVYVSLCAGLTADRRVLLLYGLFAAALAILGLGIFFVWPTAVPVSHQLWPPDSTLAFLKHVDKTGNACPSLHVAYAVYSALWADFVFRSLRCPGVWRVLSAVWCLGIVYSTIAIRQHVALDVVAGALLGAIVAIAFLQVQRQLARRLVAAIAS